MAYYVTVRDHAGKRTIYAAGPFNRHGDAQRCRGRVRRLLTTLFKADRELDWCQWGTAHVKYGPMPIGKYNAQLGLPCGRITECSFNNRWWTEGDNGWSDKPVRDQKRQQRRQERKAA